MRTVHDQTLTERSPPPAASSLHRPWSGMTAQLHDWQSGGSVVSPVLDQDIIAMRVSGSVRLTQSRAGKLHRTHATAGHVTIHARGFESRWSWDRPGAILVVRAPQYALAEAADVSIKRAGDVELRNCFGARDAFIEHIMFLFALELQRPAHPAQQLISGCLSAALAAHVVQRFNTRPTVETPDPGGLESHSVSRVTDYVRTPGVEPLTLTTLAEIAGVSSYHFARRFRRSTGLGLAEYLRRVGVPRAQETSSNDERPRGLASWQLKRVTSYMLDRLDRAVSLDELASLIDLSRGHFCTAFRLTVGRTPREWLIDRRIERARELLANPDLSITEVALALGYTPSAFGATFRERIGMTPSAFRHAL